MKSSWAESNRRNSVVMHMARTLAIGDIHGCLTALDTLLDFVALTPLDQLIFLGDYVDRGPDSRGVIERVIALNLTEQVTCLRGNHEVMMRAAVDDWESLRFWLACGGLAALYSYQTETNPPTLESVPPGHWHFLNHTCVDWHETANHVFVHANLKPDLALADQPSEWLHWQPLDSATHVPNLSGKTMICGHSEQQTGLPLVLERAICIDTWAYGQGWLTCLDVDRGEYWQSNQLGETRKGSL